MEDPLVCQYIVNPKLTRTIFKISTEHLKIYAKSHYNTKTGAKRYVYTLTRLFDSKELIDYKAFLDEYMDSPQASRMFIKLPCQDRRTKNKAMLHREVDPYNDGTTYYWLIYVPITIDVNAIVTLEFVKFTTKDPDNTEELHKLYVALQSGSPTPPTPTPIEPADCSYRFRPVNSTTGEDLPCPVSTSANFEAEEIRERRRRAKKLRVTRTTANRRRWLDEESRNLDNHPYYPALKALDILSSATCQFKDD